MVALLCAPAARAPAQGEEPFKQHLPNGMRVVVQPNDHTGTVVLSAMVRVTALHEPRGATGIRQLTQSLLATGEGCLERMRAAAVRAEGSVAPDYVELSLAAPAESLTETVALARTMLFRPALSERGLELVRPGLIRSLAARGEVGRTVALDALYQALYPGIRSGDTGAGDPVEMASITLEDVRRFHAEHYLPNATVIGISGGVDGRRAMDLVADRMGGLLPGALPAEAPEPAAGRSPGAHALDGSGQSSVLVVGGRAVSLASPTYPAMAAGMVLLGSGMDSRLYQALRLERALAYTIATELTPSATAPSGIVLVTCDPQNLDEVGEVVEQEIERVIDEPPSSAELQRAKRYLIGKHALRRQRNRQVAHYLAMFEMLGGDQGYRRDAQLAGEIASVDGNAITRAMRELFRPAWTVRLRARGTGAD
jgi:zinc protease